MKRQRIIAMFLLIIAAAGLAYSSRDLYVSAFFVLAALFGATGRLSWILPPARRIILMLAVSLLFALKYRLTTPLEEIRMLQLLGHPQWKAMAQYFLALMVLQMFLPPKKSLSSVVLVLGLATIVFAAMSLSSGYSLWVLQLLGLVYVIMAALYCSALGGQQQLRLLLSGRVLVSLVVLIVAGASGWVGGTQWSRSEVTIDSLLNKVLSPSWVFRRMVRGRSSRIKFAKETELNSVSRYHHSNAEKIVLHVFSEQMPGYLRAEVFEKYDNSRWTTSAEARVVDPSESIPEHLELTEDSPVFVVREALSVGWQTFDIWPDAGVDAGMFTPASAAVLQAPVETVLAYENNVFDYLGGSPSVDVGKILTAKDNDEMLQQDLDGEDDAIRRYKARIEQAEELKEFALAQQLRNILATEQEHAMDLRQALGK